MRGVCSAQIFAFAALDGRLLRRHVRTTTARRLRRTLALLRLHVELLVLCVALLVLGVLLLAVVETAGLALLASTGGMRADSLRRIRCLAAMRRRRLVLRLVVLLRLTPRAAHGRLRRLVLMLAVTMIRMRNGLLLLKVGSRLRVVIVTLISGVAVIMRRRVCSARLGSTCVRSAVICSVMTGLVMRAAAVACHIRIDAIRLGELIVQLRPRLLRCPAVLLRRLLATVRIETGPISLELRLARLQLLLLNAVLLRMSLLSQLVRSALVLGALLGASAARCDRYEDDQQDEDDNGDDDRWGDPARQVVHGVLSFRRCRGRCCASTGNGSSAASG